MIRIRNTDKLQKEYRSKKLLPIASILCVLKASVYTTEDTVLVGYKTKKLKYDFFSIPEWNRSEIFNKAALTLFSGFKHIIQIANCIHS